MRSSTLKGFCFFWHLAQTPPPLRSTDTGSLWSRVSSAVFIRMARRLSDTCPFFTALISCGGNSREHGTRRVGQDWERLTCHSEASWFPRAEIIICRTMRKPAAWQRKALELISASLRLRPAPWLVFVNAERGATVLM